MILEANDDVVGLSQEGIEDHRTKKGRRFPLLAIIAIALRAMLSGTNDLMAIFRRGRSTLPGNHFAKGAFSQVVHAPTGSLSRFRVFILTRVTGYVLRSPHARSAWGPFRVRLASRS